LQKENCFCLVFVRKIWDC